MGSALHELLTASALTQGMGAFCSYSENLTICYPGNIFIVHPQNQLFL